MVLAAALAPALSNAESASQSRAASAKLRFTIAVPPVFRVLGVVPVAGGQQYRVWTNQRSAQLGGRIYHFYRAGEHTIVVRTAGDAGLVHGL
jgi:hypothetical protein